MTLYMPPIARKKRVPEHYSPDSFRVISTNAEEVHPKYAGDPFYSPPNQEQVKRGVALPNIYNRSTQVLPKDVPDYRAHRPHANSCGFLRHNVRILNEPICSVFTGETHNEQHQWWPSRTSDEPLQIPPKTKDTIYRDGYMRDEPMSVKGFTRHEANPNKDAALGVVPVNFLRARDGQPRIFTEKISFEHQYNSRIDPNYPIRNKPHQTRHGSFVWDMPSKELADKFVRDQKQLDETERSQGQPSNSTGARVDVMPVYSPPRQLSPKQGITPAESAPKSPPSSKTQSPKRLNITPASTQLSVGGDCVSKQGSGSASDIKTNNVQENVNQNNETVESNNK